MIKKLATLFLIANFFIGCVSCSGASKNVEKYANITAHNLNKTCGEPEESYNITAHSFPIPAQVIRDKGCMGIKDMLTVTWYGEASEKNKTAAKLLMLMYLEHQSSGLTSEYLKTDRTVTPLGLIAHMAFFELKKATKKETE